MDTINTYSDTGYVSDINYPNSTQMTSKAVIVQQDHLDVVGVPPDMFYEMEFYAAILDYIAYYD
jgi:triacylglycerol lipase